jgi:hypothetical protein
MFDSTKLLIPLKARWQKEAVQKLVSASASTYLLNTAGHSSLYEGIGAIRRPPPCRDGLLAYFVICGF